MYARGVNTLAYIAYEQFENFKLPDETSIVDYINVFEHLKYKIHQFEMILPIAVLVYSVLNNANISSEKKQFKKV